MAFEKLKISERRCVLANKHQNDSLLCLYNPVNGKQRKPTLFCTSLVDEIETFTKMWINNHQ